MADIVVDYNSSTTGQGAFPCYDSATVGNPQVVSQVFTASETYILTQITVLLNRNGYVPGNVRCSVYSAPADEPTGAALDYAEVVASTLLTTPSKSWITFTMAGGVTLTSGSKYAIVINAIEANPTTTGFTNVFYSTDNITGGLIFSNDGEFIWDTTYFATLDCNFRTYKAEATPTKSENPTPANDGTEIDFSGLELSWDDGGGADTFNVYIGETGALTLVSSAQAGTDYTATIAELETIFGASPINQKIYWRVDATNDAGTTEGDEWNFDARPAKATTPAPTDAADDVTLDQAAMTWVDGGNSTSYNIYYGDTSGDLTSPSMGQEELSLTIAGITLGSPYDYAVTRYWRIDSINEIGVTEGDEWSFTTINFNQIMISYTLIDGGSGAGPYGTAPDFEDEPGVEGTDWRYTGENNLVTLRRLVAAAENKFWYEEL